MKVQVAQVETLGADVRVLKLGPVDAASLPEWTPGSHIDLRLGNELVRQYSLYEEPRDAGCWKVAVRLDANSRGGSRWIHDQDLEGAVLVCSEPRNNFELAPAAPAYLFLAGGIGITPFISMCEAAAGKGRPVQLAFGGPQELLAAFLPEFEHVAGLRIDLFDATAGPLPLEQLIAACAPGTAVYCCGPQGMIDATRALVRARGDLELHVEAFTAVEVETETDRPVTVELAVSGLTFAVPAGQTILDAILEHDVFLPSSCGEGTCGTCEVAVLAGTPEHRDTLTDPDDPERDKTMMVCVSRARSGRLVLDL
ncbi:PDR/VanB family oxidoreductase [Streptomyces sp. NPDC055722]